MKKHLIKHYLIIQLLITFSFLVTKLMLKACYEIELTMFSEQTLFLILLSLWLILIFFQIRKLVLLEFRQPAWYFAFLLVFAKWPIDWGYTQLALIEFVNIIWLSLYHPIIWSATVYLLLKFCIKPTKNKIS